MFASEKNCNEFYCPIIFLLGEKKNQKTFYCLPLSSYFAAISSTFFLLCSKYFIEVGHKGPSKFQLIFPSTFHIMAHAENNIQQCQYQKSFPFCRSAIFLKTNGSSINNLLFSIVCVYLFPWKRRLCSRNNSLLKNARHLSSSSSLSLRNILHTTPITILTKQPSFLFALSHFPH